MNKFSNSNVNIQSSTSRDRNILHEVIPLETPYVVGFYVGDFCNFKCVYCAQSLDNNNPESRHLIKQFMKYEDFIGYANQLKKFPDKIKTILFSSIGEPTLNKDLSKMIKYVSDLNVANEIKLITNGSNLTEQLSKELIDAGLTQILISIQGVTAESYREVCKFNMDINELLRNIEFFYNYSKSKGKEKCHIHIKTVDLALKSKEEVKLFYQLFGGICDSIHVDCVVPSFLGVDYTDILSGKKVKDTNSKKENVICCPTPFYMINVQPNGNIVPCCIAHQPIILGNAKMISVSDAWSSNKRISFLIMQLNKKRYNHPVCKKCELPCYSSSPEDIIDPFSDKLLKRFNNMINKKELL